MTLPRQTTSLIILMQWTPQGHTCEEEDASVLDVNICSKQMYWKYAMTHIIIHLLWTNLESSER